MRSLVWLGTVGLVVAAVGCAQIIGLEKRDDGSGSDGFGGEGTGGGPTGPVDEKTGKVTSDECIEYCDAMETNCPEGTEFQQYIDRDTCINSCNAFEPGDRKDPTGNTLACRLRLAKAAATSSGEFCGNAGALGGGECGTNCEAWCSLLAAACPDEYEVLLDCEAACSGLKDSGNRSFPKSYPSGADLQCRVYHVGAAFDNPKVHCAHAKYQPTSTCIEEERTPTCDEYCSTVMANCSGDRRVYDSRRECLAACEAFPIGKSSDLTENTVGCRIYHSGAAATALNHCFHASAAGDGHCGLDDEGPATGNCTSYCLLYRKGCEDEFNADFKDLEECALECTSEFADRGAKKDQGYSVSTARDDDNLKCRVYYAVKAIAGDADACEKAAPSGTCD